MGGFNLMHALSAKKMKVQKVARVRLMPNFVTDLGFGEGVGALVLARIRTCKSAWCKNNIL
jgi:hypothetical protein